MSGGATKFIWHRRKYISAEKKKQREARKQRLAPWRMPAIQTVLILSALPLLRRDKPLAEVLGALLAVAAVGVSVGSAIWERRKRKAEQELEQKHPPVNLHEAVSAASSVVDAYERLMVAISRRFDSKPVCLLIRDEADGRFRRAAWSYGPDAEVNVVTLALSRDSFVVRRLAHLSTPWVLEPKDLTVWLQAAQTMSPEIYERRNRECRALRLMATALLVRISSHDQLIGILSLARREQGEYTQLDHESLMNIAAQLALVIENSRLLERVVQHKRVEQELALAARVQRNLLPSEPPSAAGLDAAAFCQPAREVGGDYYDFVLLEDGTLAFAIGDVAGKGISAAMLMAAVQASLRSQLIEYDSSRRTPARMLDSMNRLLARNSAPEQFVTFFAGFVSADRRRFVYVNAGHNAPLLFHRKNGKSSVERPIPLDRGGPVLGVLRDVVYEEGSLELRSDDLLVAYTDGLSEAFNAAGEEFSEERLIQLVGTHPEWNANAIAASVQTSVRQWSTGVPQHDDVTFIALRVS